MTFDTYLKGPAKLLFKNSLQKGRKKGDLLEGLNQGYSNGGVKSGLFLDMF